MANAEAGSKLRAGIACAVSLVAAAQAQFFPISPSYPTASRQELRGWFESEQPPEIRAIYSGFAPIMTLIEANGFAQRGAGPDDATGLALAKQYPRLLTYAAMVSSLIFLRRLIARIPGDEFLKLAERDLDEPKQVLYLSSVAQNSKLVGFAEADFRKRFGSDRNLLSTLKTFSTWEEMREVINQLPQLNQFDRIEISFDDESDASSFQLGDGARVTVDNLQDLLATNFPAIAAQGAQLIVWSHNAGARSPIRAKEEGGPRTLAEGIGRWLLRRGGTVFACPRKLSQFEPVVYVENYGHAQGRGGQLRSALAQAAVTFTSEPLWRAIFFAADLFGQNLWEALSEIRVFAIPPRRGPGGPRTIVPSPEGPGGEIWPVSFLPIPSRYLPAEDLAEVRF